MEQIHLETKNLSFTYPDGTEASWDLTVPENQHCSLTLTV